MERKKVLLLAYTKMNLGDNLFIGYLASKYKNCDFYIHGRDQEIYYCFAKYDNINILNEYRILDNIKPDDYDLYMYVGGSVFIESEHSFNELNEILAFQKRLKASKKDFYYISSNFGPYSSSKYFELAKKVIKNCKQVYFRDKYSYDLFKDLGNVNYQPDLLFYHPSKKRMLYRRSIGISIIDLNNRGGLATKVNEYEDYIRRIILKFSKIKYRVYLFSFCNFEGDLNAIGRVLKSLPPKTRKKIKVVCYNGNMDSFLDIYSKMNLFVCTRFHSMVLSSVYNQKVYNITYSDKTTNVIKDLNLFENSISITDISYDTIMKSSQFIKCNKTELKKYNNAYLDNILK